MRPINKNARALLDHELRMRRLSDAATLATALDISQPTLLRIIHERGDEVVRIGTTKNARYALRRPLRGKAEPIPVYKIDENGKGKLLTYLDLASSEGAVLDVKSMGWPTDTVASSWWDGLPYPLADMRPQGFLGRNLARQISQTFGVSENPDEWSDDDVIYILSIKGSDTQGNLIIGETAYQEYLDKLAKPDSSISWDQVKVEYPRLAELATQHGIAGSSAGGEFPKFTVKREHPTASNPYAIVKFSGSDDSASVRRWSDLLVCEHLALEVISRTYRLDAPLSQIIPAKGRTFLEVERFDRIGELGRKGTVSLGSLDNAYGGGQGNWIDAANRLVKAKVIRSDLIEDISVLWWFGKLIANTDMHYGNLTFLIEPEVRLTPSYDMLPMQYAPHRGGEVPVIEFELTLPKPQEEEVWNQAFSMALEFWYLASRDGRITEGFKEICKSNFEALQSLNNRLGLGIDYLPEWDTFYFDKFKEGDDDLGAYVQLVNSKKDPSRISSNRILKSNHEHNVQLEIGLELVIKLGMQKFIYRGDEDIQVVGNNIAKLLRDVDEKNNKLIRY